MDNIFYTLITGGSEGFGKALAIECASRNMNLILVALPGSELHQLADFLKEKYMVQVVVIEKDLCVEDGCLEVYKEVHSKGLQVNMLFNNAGIGSTSLFQEGSIDVYERQIKLNVLATTIMTRLFLDMLKQNKPAYILNVGSLASYFPLPKKQVYGATKSFVFYFSKCLRKELEKEQVYVTVLCPGAMNTNMAVQLLNKNGNYLIRNSTLEPEQVAPPVIDGLLKRRKVMVPGKLNKCYVFVYSVLPEFIKSIITNRSMEKLNSLNAQNISLQNPLSNIPVTVTTTI